MRDGLPLASIAGDRIKRVREVAFRQMGVLFTVVVVLALGYALSRFQEGHRIAPIPARRPEPADEALRLLRRSFAAGAIDAIEYRNHLEALRRG